MEGVWGICVLRAFLLKEDHDFVLTLPFLLRNLSIRLMGGALDLRGKQKTYWVAASTMIRYAE